MKINVGKDQIFVSWSDNKNVLIESGSPGGSIIDSKNVSVDEILFVVRLMNFVRENLPK